MDGVDYPAVNNGDGTWTLADNTLPALTDGPHTITVTATDAAGNVGNDTAVVTIDTVAPNAPVLDPINATDPVSGQAEPGSTVTVTYPDGTTATVVAGTDGSWSVPNPGNLVDGVDYPAVNNGDGTWTLADNTLPALTDGPHTITVTA
ncbi:Ig-like domain-containing protein, partial [Acinetobacter baumannii]